MGDALFSAPLTMGDAAVPISVVHYRTYDANDVSLCSAVMFFVYWLGVLAFSAKTSGVDIKHELDSYEVAFWCFNSSYALYELNEILQVTNRLSSVLYVLCMTLLCVECHRKGGVSIWVSRGKVTVMCKEEVSVSPLLFDYIVFVQQ